MNKTIQYVMGFDSEAVYIDDELFISRKNDINVSLLLEKLIERGYLKCDLVRYVTSGEIEEFLWDNGYPKYIKDLKLEEFAVNLGNGKII